MVLTPGVVVVAAAQEERGCAAEVGAGRCLVVVVGHGCCSFLQALLMMMRPATTPRGRPAGGRLSSHASARFERRGAARGSRDTAGLALLLDGAEVALSVRARARSHTSQILRPVRGRGAPLVPALSLERRETM
jgi:hypothetical protein